LTLVTIWAAMSRSFEVAVLRCARKKDRGPGIVSQRAAGLI
jgi:hypothetical protein